LLCDLVNSTEIPTRLDPEEWRDIAARYQRTAAEAVARFGSHAAEYLGDGLVVYFSHAEAHEDDGERALRAGLAIIDAIAALNERLAGEQNVRLSPVGIHHRLGGRNAPLRDHKRRRFPDRRLGGGKQRPNGTGAKRGGADMKAENRAS